MNLSEDWLTVRNGRVHPVETELGCIALQGDILLVQLFLELHILGAKSVGLIDKLGNDALL